MWASGLAQAYVRGILESNVLMLVVEMPKCFSFSFFSCLALFLDGIWNCSLLQRIHIWKLAVYLSLLEFVTGRTGPRKTQASGPFPRPAPLNGLGRGVFFGIPCPSPRLGPCPTHTPDGSLSKIGGNKRGPVQGMSASGPRTGAGRGLPPNTPPALCKGGVCRVKTRPAPPRNEH